MSLCVTTLCFLDCQNQWSALSDQEKLFAHYLNEANWSGYPIAVQQVSRESWGIFTAILKTHRTVPLSTLPTACPTISPDDIKAYTNYVVSVLSNGGNYLSFGDTKFVPGCSRETFVAIASTCGTNHFADVLDAMYATDTHLLSLGLAPHGTSMFYTDGMTADEIKAVDATLLRHGILTENTRIVREEGKTVVEIASTEQRTASIDGLELRYGLFRDELAAVVASLQKALSLPFVQQDEVRRNVVSLLVEAFTTGDMQKYKDAQRWWVQEKRPTVEFAFGFIEVYKDPLGVRGEWEALVAVVGKEKSRELWALVDAAPEILPALPWGRVFEKERFDAPAFSSIDVLGFGGCKMYAGINLPNFNDIRADGFKNVSLNNVMTSRLTTTLPKHIAPEDKDVYLAHVDRVDEIHVALHELYGHGSGRLLRCDNGVRNFPEGLVNPFTGRPVSYYREGEDFHTVFKDLCSPLEECRADCVALLLPEVCPAVCRVLNVTEEQRRVGWLETMRQGLAGKRHYNAATGKWGNIYAQERWAILQVALRSGYVVVGEDEVVHLVDEKHEAGVAALRTFVEQLQIARATADVAFAREFFLPLTTVSTPAEPSEQDTQRGVSCVGYVQGNTRCVDGVVHYVTYPTTPDGMVQSFCDRYL